MKNLHENYNYSSTLLMAQTPLTPLKPKIIIVYIKNKRNGCIFVFFFQCIRIFYKNDSES